MLCLLARKRIIEADSIAEAIKAAGAEVEIK